MNVNINNQMIFMKKTETSCDLGLNFPDQCRLVTQDTPDVSPLLCQAMEALQDRPVLLK